MPRVLYGFGCDSVMTEEVYPRQNRNKGDVIGLRSLGFRLPAEGFSVGVLQRALLVSGLAQRRHL